MLRELTKADWLAALDLPKARVPPVLILRGTRNLGSRYQAALPHFSNVHELGSPNGIFEQVLIGERNGCLVGFACVYGAAMASEIVHLFGVLGTRAVIQTGNCGALADGLVAGDLFIAERAFCGEGAARYYKPGADWVAASPSFLQAEVLAALRPEEHRRGIIYTTAALLAEGAEDLERWFRDGFSAVDMETATTYAVADYFGMERLAILYVFDNPRQRDHLLLTDAQKDARRAAADARVWQLALDLAAEICARPL